MRAQNHIFNRYTPFLLILLLLNSCRLEQKKPGERLLVVCTTGMIGDVVENICGDASEVRTIMGPGVDPHLYKPTPSDIRLLQNADVIVHNGLHLEGKMGEIFHKLEGEKLIVNWSEAIPRSKLLASSEYEESYDPHIWFDPDLFVLGAELFTSKMMAKDSLNESQFSKNLNSFKNRLNKVGFRLDSMISAIPKENRILITSHDAFSYFGEKYKFQVRGLQGISTVAEFGIKDKIDLLNFIFENDVHVLFVESSVSSKSLESVVESCKKKGHSIKIGGTLLSDAMDSKDRPGGTYLGMIEYNVVTIVNGINE